MWALGSCRIICLSIEIELFHIFVNISRMVLLESESPQNRAPYFLFLLLASAAEPSENRTDGCSYLSVFLQAQRSTS